MSSLCTSTDVGSNNAMVWTKVSQLRKERALLLGELSTLRAKFELTLQTLRALLGLELSCTWADIVEHVELLTRVADGRKGKEPPDAEEREVEELQQLLLNAEMDLDEKEKQLEEQQNRVQSLSNVLAKQQNAEQLRELSHVQQRRLQEKESQLSSAEASLATNQQALFRREKELADEPESFGGTDSAPNPVEVLLFSLGACQEITTKAFANAMGVPLKRVSVELQGHIDLRGFFAVDESIRAGFNKIEGTFTVESPADTETIEKLKAAVDAHCPVKDMLQAVEHIRSQLEVFEAAERRKHSYRSGSSTFLGRVASARSLDGSEPSSSIGSAQPSARGERRPESSVPSTPGAAPTAVSPTSSRRALRPVAPLASMDKEERAAFLSHFPMASRTERHAFNVCSLIHLICYPSELEAPPAPD
eukprot:g12813.t1